MMGEMSFADFLKREKDKRNMSQRELAGFLGVSESQISHWITGINSPYSAVEKALRQKLSEPEGKKDGWLTVDDAAKRIGVPLEEVQEWIRERYIEHFRLPNGRIRLKPEAIDNFFAACYVAAKPMERGECDV